MADRSTTGTLPSDLLHTIGELLRTLPTVVEAVGPIRQLLVVVDTSAVAADLRWLAVVRRDSGARTTLQELFANRTLVGVAPPTLLQEVEEHLPEWALEWGVFEHELRSLWIAYSTQLRVLTPDEESSWHDLNADRDPSDHPFLVLCAELGAAAIITDDPDIAGMGGVTLNKTFRLQLRVYSRARAVEITLTLGGVTVSGLGFAAAIGLIRTIVAGVKALCRLPGWLQLALLAGAGLLLAHPMSRRWLLEVFNWVRTQCRQLLKATHPHINAALSAHATAHHASTASWDRVVRELPRRGQMTLAAAVLTVCLQEHDPLSVDQLERAVCVMGYRTKQKDLKPYLRRVLRNHPRITACPDGRWALTTQPATNRPRSSR